MAGPYGLGYLETRVTAPGDAVVVASPLEALLQEPASCADAVPRERL